MCRRRKIGLQRLSLINFEIKIRWMHDIVLHYFVDCPRYAFIILRSWMVTIMLDFTVTFWRKVTRLDRETFETILEFFQSLDLSKTSFSFLDYFIHKSAISTLWFLQRSIPRQNKASFQPSNFSLKSRKVKTGPVILLCAKYTFPWRNSFKPKPCGKIILQICLDTIQQYRNQGHRNFLGHAGSN